MGRKYERLGNDPRQSFGYGFAKCSESACGARTWNRGCAHCATVYCGKCYPEHVISCRCARTAISQELADAGSFDVIEMCCKTRLSSPISTLTAHPFVRER